MIDDNVTLPSRRRIELMRLSATAVTAGYVGGVHLHLPGFSTMQYPAAVPAGFAVAIALVAALAGWGLVEALERRTAHPRRTWLITAPVVLLVSLGGPLSGHGVSAGGPPRAGPPAPHSRCRALAALGRTLATHREPAQPNPARPQRHQPKRQPDDHHDRSHLSHELACRVTDGVTLVRRLPGGGTGAVAAALRVMNGRAPAVTMCARPF